MQRGSLLLKLWLERLRFTAFLWLDSAAVFLLNRGLRFLLYYFLYIAHYFVTLHSKFKRILKCIDP
jgi:hypothetical protein